MLLLKEQLEKSNSEGVSANPIEIGDDVRPRIDAAKRVDTAIKKNHAKFVMMEVGDVPEKVELELGDLDLEAAAEKVRV